MGIQVGLHHITQYRYDRSIQLGPQIIRLRPAPHTKAHIQSFSLWITPTHHFINWQQDPFGNFVARLVLPDKTQEFRVEIDLVTEICVFNPFDFFLEETAKHFPFSYETTLKEELSPYLEIKEKGILLTNLIQAIDLNGENTIDFLMKLNQNIYTSLNYAIRLEPGIQSCEQTLSQEQGSCRDMAWLLCQILRHLGLAARFVSGYLIQLKLDAVPLEGPKGVVEDSLELHSWVEVYLPGAGWIGLDPTSGLLTGENHIPLCCTPNPSSAAPITGSMECCKNQMIHEMKITRLHEEYRPNKPYSEDEWKKIDNLGLQVDDDLMTEDVRLTMGGEPTFVSLDDKTAKEWHYTALGGIKKNLANDLAARLQHQFIRGSLLQYGQGKWYPDESAPRWAIHCIARKDGETLWQNEALLATPDKSQTRTHGSAQRFLTTLANHLGIATSYVLAAYEDSLYYLWQEQRGIKAKQKTDKSHTSIDLQIPAGFVLPLHYSAKWDKWISTPWQFSSGRLNLTHSNLPISLRLPISHLSETANNDDEIHPERSHFASQTPLITRQSILKKIATRAKLSDKASPSHPTSQRFVKTALCTEINNGVLHVFLPPLAYVEHFIDLITTIEIVAEKLNISLIIDGHAPPKDLRLECFSVTPDPGVIEVNTQPSASWNELKHITFTVFQQARMARLTTEKFLMDGRTVSTGGGNHILVGAAYPEHSPFLRRPDLLKSLISFWQNHPSLSYLFSSMYVGPTSQSPRVDEARHDSLYEMEIAFAQIPDRTQSISPWLIDRLFRNILVDLTGNTHRAEFCIDKLYNPETEMGRLGLLEFRCFEMSPHPHMNLLQCLLVRTAIAAFWKNPYQHKLIPWGTRLQDQFMLAEYLHDDLENVLAFFHQLNYHFEISWFKPFFDFRFPKFGSVQLGPITLELRMALEPWPVLGEELEQGSVSRAVDSSVERLQIKISGLIEGCHVVTCNQHTIPLKPTHEQGVYVAGIRYKAWKQAKSLHPNITSHAPLVFDVIDVNLKRSLGGCTYHVSHPGGRHYDTLPINANEAEGRRLARFQTMGHTPGTIDVKPPRVHPDFPHTLDLRLV